MTRETVGKIASDLLKQEAHNIDPIEAAQENQKKYWDELFWTVAHAKKKVSCESNPNHRPETCTIIEPMYGDIYVCVILRGERLISNLIRTQFYPNIDCPTPTWDQTVWKYHEKEEGFEHLWTIPDEETCNTLYYNALDVVESERESLRFVIEYFDGTLFKLAKKLNGECNDSPLLDK